MRRNCALAAAAIASRTLSPGSFARSILGSRLTRNARSRIRLMRQPISAGSKWRRTSASRGALRSSSRRASAETSSNRPSSHARTSLHGLASTRISVLGETFVSRMTRGSVLGACVSAANAPTSADPIARPAPAAAHLRSPTRFSPPARSRSALGRPRRSARSRPHRALDELGKVALLQAALREKRAQGHVKRASGRTGRRGGALAGKPGCVRILTISAG